MTLSPRLPTPSELYEPLLVTLGAMTDYQPGIGIHMERAFFPTLARFGIDEEKRRAYEDAGLLYPEPGRSHAPTLWRKFQLAFRYMKDGVVNGEQATRVYQEQPKFWMLSPWGASLAADLAPVVDTDVMEFFLEDDDDDLPRENLTRIWFQQNWKDMYPHLQRYMRTHAEKSSIQDLTDDHMHNYVVTAISNDSFRPHLDRSEVVVVLTGELDEGETLKSFKKMLEAKYAKSGEVEAIENDEGKAMFRIEGFRGLVQKVHQNDDLMVVSERSLEPKKIYPSTLCSFVLRRAYTDMRTWGSDPSCRAIRGAINERDRRRAKAFHEEHPTYAQDRIHSREHQRASKGIGRVNFELSGGEDGPRFRNSGTNGNAVLDSYGGDFESEMMESITMERTMDAIANALHEELGENGEDACEIYMLRETAGMTYPEIARYKGIPESRATSLVKKAKAALAAHAKEGLLPELDETKFST